MQREQKEPGYRPHCVDSKPARIALEELRTDSEKYHGRRVDVMADVRLQFEKVVIVETGAWLNLPYPPPFEFVTGNYRMQLIGVWAHDPSRSYGHFGFYDSALFADRVYFRDGIC